VESRPTTCMEEGGETHTVTMLEPKSCNLKSLVCNPTRIHRPQDVRSLASGQHEPE
jgi:hypothetical protein